MLKFISTIFKLSNVKDKIKKYLKLKKPEPCLDGAKIIFFFDFPWTAVGWVVYRYSSQFVGFLENPCLPIGAAAPNIKKNLRSFFH